jgi:Domain of unknown function (DUF4265)
MTKIAFDLDHTEWHGHPAETLWADLVPEIGANTFLLKNSPFFAMGVSYLDIVEGMPTEGSELFDFKRVIKRGGHSTYMLLVEDKQPRFHEYWNSLESLGCSYEHGGPIELPIGYRHFYSVDVPPSTNLAQVIARLEKGQADNIWMYQEGYKAT